MKAAKGRLKVKQDQFGQIASCFGFGLEEESQRVGVHAACTRAKTRGTHHPSPWLGFTSESEP